MSDTLTSGEVSVLAAMFGALVAGSVVRLVRLRRDDTERARSRRASLGTWWVLAILMTTAVLAGSAGICLLLGTASWMSVSEYHALAVGGQRGRGSSDLVRLTIPGVYLAVYLGWGVPALAVLPAVVVLLLAASEIRRGVTHGYVRSLGAHVLGAVVLIGGPAHAALAVTAPVHETGGGIAGWFIFLILLTEGNDIAQALIGRWIGSHPVTAVSPGKTWEGFAGGACVTVLLGLVLAPVLTPLTRNGEPLSTTWPWIASWGWALASGLTVSLAGFIGDLNMSAVKRDAGVKDSSRVLPGMGGMLDRIDSLTLAAPALYWLVVVPTS